MNFQAKNYFDGGGGSGGGWVVLALANPSQATCIGGYNNIGGDMETIQMVVCIQKLYAYGRGRNHFQVRIIKLDRDDEKIIPWKKKRQTN